MPACMPENQDAKYQQKQTRAQEEGKAAMKSGTTKNLSQGRSSR